MTQTDATLAVLDAQSKAIQELVKAINLLPNMLDEIQKQQERDYRNIMLEFSRLKQLINLNNLTSLESQDVHDFEEQERQEIIDNSEAANETYYHEISGDNN